MNEKIISDLGNGSDGVQMKVVARYVVEEKVAEETARMEIKMKERK
jgi:hypothetical protein